jgi:hypothetical protein
MRPVPRQSRFGAPLALVCAAILGVLVATPWSSAMAAEDTEEPKAIKSSEPDSTQQAEDTEKAKDKSLLTHKPADDAVASKQNDEAFYTKWQFWAITGGIVAGAALAVFGGYFLYHSLNGGDVRPCNPSSLCFGQGH